MTTGIAGGPLGTASGVADSATGLAGSSNGIAGLFTGISGNTGGSVVPTALRAFGIRTMNTTFGSDSTSFTTAINGANFQIVHPMLTSYFANTIQFADANRQSGTPAANSITIARQIEYPAGVFTRVTWSGANSVTIPVGGADTWSDPLPISLPAGSRYVEHVFVSGFAVGTGFPFLHVRQLLAANGDSFSLSASETDKTGQSLPPASNAWYYGAVAIKGQTNAPRAVAIIGDSIASAGGDTQTGFFVSYVERAVNGLYGTVNTSQSSETGLDWLQNRTARLALIRSSGCTDCIVEMGTNDIAIPATAAAALSRDQMLNDLMAASGITPINVTIPPRINWSGTAVGPADQTPQAGFATGSTTGRDGYNTAQRTTPLIFSQALLDMAPSVEDQANLGKWKTDGVTPDLYTADGIHPNAFSAPIAAASVAPVIQGLSSPVPFPVPTVFSAATFDFDAATIPPQVDNSNFVGPWVDKISGATLANLAAPPKFRLSTTPDATYNGLQTVAATANQGLSGVSSGFDNWNAGDFYMLAAFSWTSAATNTFLFNKATSNNRLILVTGGTMQFDLFYNTGTYSFQLVPLAGAVGANNWVVLELTWRIATPTQLGYRSGAAGLGGITSGTTTASTSGSGGPKVDTGSSLFLSNVSGGTSTLPGTVSRFAAWKTIPAQADRDAAFHYLRGLIGA